MDSALWFVGPRRVELRPIDVGPVGPHAVRVRTLCSGVSAGTELLAYRGELPADLPIDERIGALGGTFGYPFQYGYATVGEVEEVGGDVHDVAVGDVVFAFQPHQGRFVSAASAVMPVGDLEPRIAVLLPYVETALQISLDAGPVLAETVIVTGLGTLGLLVAALVERAGGHVLAIEPQPWRRVLAADLGIEAVASARDALDVLTARDAAVPLAIECSGSPRALPPLLDVLAHEGTLLVASWYGSKPVALPLGGAFHRRRLTIRSTQVSTIPAAASGRWTHRRRLEHARDLAPTLPLGDLATDTVPLRHADHGYARLDVGEPGLMHLAFGYG